METETEAPDLDELAALTGCTPLQAKFAWHLSQGDSQVESAFRGGYRGARDSVQLRTQGSNAAKSANVQAMLAALANRGFSVPDQPGDLEELHKILWRIARGRDKSHAVN